MIVVKMGGLLVMLYADTHYILPDETNITALLHATNNAIRRGSLNN